MYIIRRIAKDEVEEALKLALDVFMQFEAPDYTMDGVWNFRYGMVENPEFIKDCKDGVCPIYAAFEEGQMIGIMGLRPDKTHINLAFTKSEYQRRGVATSLFYHILQEIRRENPSLKQLTLNSSPYGLPFYLHLGFVPLSGEREMDGIRYTPMAYDIKRPENEK